MRPVFHIVHDNWLVYCGIVKITTNVSSQWNCNSCHIFILISVRSWTEYIYPWGLAFSPLPFPFFFSLYVRYVVLCKSEPVQIQNDITTLYAYLLHDKYVTGTHNVAEVESTTTRPIRSSPLRLAAGKTLIPKSHQGRHFCLIHMYIYNRGIGSPPKKKNIKSRILTIQKFSFICIYMIFRGADGMNATFCTVHVCIQLYTHTREVKKCWCMPKLQTHQVLYIYMWQ